MESYHPIMSKLRDLGGPTYRQTDRQTDRQAKVKNRVFVKLNMRYADYFS